MHTTTRRTLGLTSGVLIGAALLTGCAIHPDNTSTPTTAATKTHTPTPTPTPTELSAPKTDAEAQAQAEKTLRNQLAATNKAENNNGKGIEEVEKYTTGQALADIKESIKASQLDKTTRTGEQKMTVISGYSASLEANGQQIPHAAVTLTVCNDISDVKYTKADGTPNQRPDWEQSKVSVEVIYSPADHAWFVRDESLVEKSC